MGELCVRCVSSLFIQVSLMMFFLAISFLCFFITCTLPHSQRPLPPPYLQTLKNPHIAHRIKGYHTRLRITP